MTEGERRRYREFGQWLRARRLARRWTQEELAARLSYEVSYVRKIEWGTTRSTEAFRARLAEIFELPVDSLPPAEARAATASSGVPVPATSLVGRDDEIDAVSGILLRGPGLVTLVGAPGIGKTRLAVAVAARLDQQLEHGARFVSLVHVPEPERVAGAVGATLGLRAADDPSAAEKALADHLAGKDVLLVLDNFEHVLGAAGLVGRLLAAAPTVRALATSRQALDVAGEVQYPVPQLGSAAVDLFVDRARLVRPDFAPTADVVAVCERLDGVPLAIELAAAAVRLMSPAQLLSELDHVLDLPTSGPRDAPAHQRTLRATIDWSHRLLTDDEQALLARIGVFVGGFTLEAAVAVGGGGGEDRAAVVAGLASLVGKSLLEARPDAPGGPRFVALQAVREYALERLAERQEHHEVRRGHAGYYAALAEEAAVELVGKDQARWLDVMGEEHGNFVAALRWAAASDPSQALRLAGALWRFWFLRGHLTEGRRSLEQALAGAASDDPWRARAATGAGVLARMQGDYQRAARLFGEAAELAGRAGDDDELALAVLNTAITRENQGDYDGAAAAFQESLDLYRRTGNQRGVGHALNGLGHVALDRGDRLAAVRFFEQSLAAFRALEDQWSVALVCTNLGWVAQVSGDTGRAGAWYARSLSVHRALGHERGIANTLCNIGRVAFLEGDSRRATGCLEEALLLFRALGERRGVAECLEELGRVGVAEADFERAVRLYSAATALRESIGAPLWPNELGEQEAALEAARAGLTPGGYDRAWADGQAMSTQDAVSLALTRPSTDLISP